MAWWFNCSNTQPYILKYSLDASYIAFVQAAGLIFLGSKYLFSSEVCTYPLQYKLLLCSESLYSFQKTKSK